MAVYLRHVRHQESSVRYLDDKSTALRQHEISGEIEVILPNTSRQHNQPW
jgi:hypothetical protein